METYPLIPHPDFPPSLLSGIEARIVGRDDRWLRLRWRLFDARAVVFPPFAGKGRATDLWKNTCFELFLRPEGGQAYVELNLSPSERWAAYDFVSWREGMADRPMPREPECTARVGQRMAIFDAAVPAAGLPVGPAHVGLSAVIEEEGGVISYWSIAHPRGKPDFHDAACFAAELPAPGAP
ncbi:MAG: DOMON-like domain-containing protein [Novosphingobium sp.]|nr:DOMON-like domain-containing protein [Novosphingobium sp.]MCP5401342.1 DOMON-like domain-containing protein [Novosphingobium sp.]